MRSTWMVLTGVVVFSTLALTGCSSSGPAVDPKAVAFCKAFESAIAASEADFGQHVDLFQAAEAIAPDEIKAAIQGVVTERQAAAASGNSTQGGLEGLTQNGLKVQEYCLAHGAIKN